MAIKTAQCMKIIFRLSFYLPLGLLAQGGSSVSGPYFGLTAPTQKAKILLDGILCHENSPQMCSAFSKDGRTFYYCEKRGEHWQIVFTQEIDGHWTPSKALGFSDAHYTDRDFTLSPDGFKLLFGSNRPRQAGQAAEQKLHLFYSDWIDGAWTQPQPFDETVNAYGGNYPAMAANGNLYFFRSRQTVEGKCDLFVSRYEKGRYQTPVSLGPSVNSAQNDWDCCVAPDESYIIFSSQNRDDTLGDQDLYIAFKGNSGQWLKAVNMGPKVNSFSSEICPFVTLDGRYLLFTSRRRGIADIYWIDAAIIEDYRQ